MQTINLLAKIAVIIASFSVPYAIFLFFREKRKERKENELKTYTDLAREYRNYLRLCIEHTELQCHDFNPKTNIKLNDEQKAKQIILFEILVSMFESAFYQYQDQTSEFKEKQWQGWVEYISDWCSRSDFKSAWDKHLGYQYDKQFMKFMRGNFSNIENKGQQN